MSVGSALASGNEALPGLAEEAFQLALQNSGASHARGVLLLLTQEFSRCTQQTVTAVARTAQCTEVAGGLAAGVFTDDGWVIDRPAAAVMVFAGGLWLDHRPAGESIVDLAGDRDPGDALGGALLSYAGSRFPAEWGESATPRFGGSFVGDLGRSESVAWQHSRLAAQCSLRLGGAQIDVGVSSGWRLLGSPTPVDSSRGHELFSVGGRSALDSLTRVLPAEQRQQTRLPLASLCAVATDSGAAGGTATDRGWHTVAILSANADKSLTLAERITPGQNLAWAIRQPQAAVDDMRQLLGRLAGVVARPLAAVVFSCIGRGPCFHDGRDRELECLRERFPGLPLVGSYGTGQIAPAAAGGSRLLQNAVVTALISEATRRADVQPQP
ncbi:MAG: FIST C-terminal domain-containing protein [Rhodobacteraceae bacterium]|nr:FIST C-terminal domain-containing protein [Paracoccaceae bacterium]